MYLTTINKIFHTYYLGLISDSWGEGGQNGIFQWKQPCFEQTWYISLQSTYCLRVLLRCGMWIFIRQWNDVILCAFWVHRDGLQDKYSFLYEVHWSSAISQPTMLLIACGVNNVCVYKVDSLCSLFLQQERNSHNQ